MRSFIDKDHPVATQFYEIIEGKHGIEDLMHLIKIDPDFLDPYLYLCEALIDQGHEKEAEMFAEKSFVRALGMILDLDGSWPDELLWGFHENRHIIKVLMRKADFEWQQGRTDNALVLYKNLLRTNLNDNIGARYAIVGIKNGFTYKKYMKQVWPNNMTPAATIESWFKKYAPNCPEDLAQWRQYCIDVIGLKEDEIC